jgi:endonuclease/exonuclease/phosphatase family metal-dependent hydrolase
MVRPGNTRGSTPAANTMDRRGDTFSVEIAALTWNLFHGRDFPPNPALFTVRSRLFGAAEQDATHAQVNRELLDEFGGLLCRAHWDLALLQECPPRWGAALASACRARAELSLTSRNWLAPIRTALARRNPDLLGSWEGGSNVIMLRGPLGTKGGERRDLVLRRFPERRTMCFARSPAGLCVANLHATTVPRLAEEDLRKAAAAAADWAADSPLILGGDFNLRPNDSEIFDELAKRFELRRPTASDAIDHLLACGLETVAAPSLWPPEAREVPWDDRTLRLSDHAPVEARFRIRVEGSNLTTTRP